MGLFLFYTLLDLLFISLSSCDPNYGKYLIGNTIRVIEIVGRKGSRKECVSVTSCLSYNFDRISLTCELKTDTASTGQLISRDSSSYEEKINFVQENDNPCSTANCPEYSKCVPLRKGNIKCINHECRNNPPTVENAIRSTNGTHFVTGTKVAYTCNAGYPLTGVSEVTCKANMNWSSIGFQCAGCGAPPVVNHANINSGSSTLGSSRTYACSLGYSSPSIISTTCGTNPVAWSTPSGSCTIVNCGNPPTVSGATVNSGATTYNTQRAYTCNVGYDSNGGNANTQCSSSGSWSTVGLVCTIKDCGNPLAITNAVIGAGSTTAGSSRTYTCNSGTAASGSPATISCQNSGIWQSTTFACTVSGCQNALVVFGATVTGSGTTTGSTRTVTCDVGYEQTVGSGSATSTCQANGQWSTPNINCAKCSTFGSSFTLRQNMFFNPPVSFTPSISGGSVDAAFCKNACVGRNDFVCVAAYYRKSPSGYCIVRPQRVHDKTSYPQYYKTNNAYDEYIRNCA